MKKYQTKPATSTTKINSGDILIAKPFIPDDLYRRTVVLIVQHDEYNSTGLILNKPTAMRVDSLLPLLPFKSPLMIGGPIESNLVTFLHDIASFDEALPLGNGLYWGGSHEFLESQVAKREDLHERLRFFAGITSWGAGELETELNQDYWWKADVSAGEIFDPSVSDMRNYLLLREDNLFGVLEDVPDPVMS